MAQEGKKGSAKKPGPAKCRGCGGLLDEKDRILIGGNKWHQRCAESKKKLIPKEYAGK